jgi:hypothetical protein
MGSSSPFMNKAFRGTDVDSSDENPLIAFHAGVLVFGSYILMIDFNGDRFCNHIH